MLDCIGISNFGCFDGEHSMDFKKLTVIVGPNNSGKSTFFKALNLFRIYQQSGDASKIWNSDYYSLNNFECTAYDASSTSHIIVGANERVASLLLDNGGIYWEETNQFKQNSKMGTPGAVKRYALDVNLKRITYIGSSRRPISLQNSTMSSYGNPDNRNDYFNEEIQEIYPDGRNMIRFLLEKNSAEDSRMPEFKRWLQKIDSKIELFKAPVVRSDTSLLTKRNDGKGSKEINLHFQGNGIQNAVIIIAAVVFSPEDSTIIIEEPELYQHDRSVEVLVDLFNHAVKEMNKQIIIVTHSFEIINAYCSDIGKGTSRGGDHVIANPDDFKLVMVKEDPGSQKIQEYILTDKKYTDVRNDFKKLLG